MIQRIQSLYLFIISLLSSVLFSGSILTFISSSGAIIKITFINIVKSTEANGIELIGKLLPLSVILILIPILSLITIFIFRKRNIQLRLALFLIILCILLVIALIHGSVIAISKQNASLVPGFKMIVPIANLILSFLAYLGIRKDDQLVKSYDRLR
jgi:glucan phosphoethanolaminetransferase (alkaline phosphatase superfamily)